MAYFGARTSLLALVLIGAVGTGSADALTRDEIAQLRLLARPSSDDYRSRKVAEAIQALDAKQLLRPMEGSLISIVVRSGDPEAIARLDELVLYQVISEGMGEAGDISDPAWLDQVEREIQAVQAAMLKYLGDGSTEAIFQRLQVDWIGYDGSFFTISRVLTLDGLGNYEPLGFVEFLENARRRNRLVFERYLTFLVPFARKFENFRKVFVFSAEKHRRQAAEELHENHGRLTSAIGATRALLAADRGAARPE